MKNKFEEPLPDKVPNNSEDDINKKFGVKFGVKFGIKFGVNDKQLLLSLDKTPGIWPCCPYLTASRRGRISSMEKSAS